MMLALESVISDCIFGEKDESALLMRTMRATLKVSTHTMKKTLITLAALAVASAAQADTKLVEWTTFGTTGASTYSSTGEALTVSTNHYTNGASISNGALTIGNQGRAYVDLSSLGINLATGSYTFEFTASSFATYGEPMFSVTTGGSGTQSAAFGSAYTSSKFFWAFSDDGNSMKDNLGKEVSSTSGSGTFKVSFLYDSVLKKNYVEAYLNGTAIYERTAIAYEDLEESYTSPINGNLSSLTFNGWGSGNGKDGQSLTLTSFSISQTQNLPEPTTATLSLLALAGLAARRRRK